MISTKGLSRAAVLAALYNASRPLGLGFLHYDPKPMTVEEAEELLRVYDSVHGDGRYDFDYLKGRVMKIFLADENRFDERLYDRDNGQGAAQRAIDQLRREMT